MNSIKGVDVSVYQRGCVDWLDFAERGYKFAMVKAGQGHALFSSAVYFEDSAYMDHVKGAFDAGLSVGAYYYATFTSVEEAEREAKEFVFLLDKARKYITLWAAVDVEDIATPKYCGKLNKDELTACILQFCEIVQEAGYKPMLYTNRDYLQNHLIYDRLKKIPLWRAHWRSGEDIEPKDSPKDFSENMKIWQWGSRWGIDQNFGFFETPESEKQSEIFRKPLRLNICEYCPFKKQKKEE